MPFCPNFNNPDIKRDFTTVSDVVGINGAYYLWNKYEGNMRKIMDHINSIVPTLKMPAPKKVDPYERLKMKRPDTKFKSNVSVLASNAKMNVEKYRQDRFDNNKTIWEVEKKYGLSSFRQTEDGLFKVFTPLTDSQAKKIEADIRAHYMSKPGTPKLEFQRVEAGDGNTSKTGLRIKGWFRDPFSFDLMADVEQDVREELALLRLEAQEDIAPLHKEQAPVVKTLEDLERIDNINKQIEGVIDPYGVLQSLFIKDKNIQAIVDAIVAKKEDNPNIKIKLIDRTNVQNETMLDALMYFNPSDNTIYVIREASESPTANSYDFYAGAIVHEFVHSFTAKAILNPQSEQDRAFKEEMTKLWKIAKKNASNKDLPGLQSLEEFTADITEDADLINETKRMPYNIWTRILNAIGKLLGIQKWAEYGTLYQRGLEQVMNHIQSEDKFEMVTLDPSVYLMKKAQDTKEGPTLRDWARTSNSVQTQIFELRRLYADDPEFGSKLKELLKQYSKEFKENVDNSVTHKTSLIKFLSVSRLMDEYGYVFDGAKDLEKEAEYAADLGSITHGMNEAIINGVKVSFKNKSGINTSSGMRKDMEKIISGIVQPDDKMVIAEVDVYSPTRGIHGKIDLVRMDSNGHVHIYDFKTKQKGFEHFTDRFPDSEGALKYSDQQKAHTQLTLYKLMWEELTKISVSTMNTIMVKPTVDKSNTIKSVKLDNSVNAFGIDELVRPSMYGVKIFEDLDTDFLTRKESILDNTPGNDLKNITLRIENTLRTASYKAMETARLESVINTTITNLESQIKSLNRVGNTARAKDLEQKVKDLKEGKSNIEAINTITKIAMEEADSINRQHIANLKEGRKGENVDIRQLKRWKQVMENYSDLYEYARYVKALLPEQELDPLQKAETIAQRKKLVSDIEEVAKAINDIGELYITASTEKLLKFLEPNYNKIYSDFRNELKKAYNKKSKLEKREITEEQFIIEGMRDEAKSLKESTRKALEQEILRASSDPNVLERWLDNLPGSKDAITASMVKSFAEAEWKNRQEAMPVKENIIELLREVEKIYPNLPLTDPRKLYSWMLEEDEKGQFTGYLVDSHHSSLLNDYREFQKNEPDKDKQRKWKEARAPLNKVALKKARYEYFEQLLKPIDGSAPKINIEEYNNLLQHFKRRKRNWSPEGALLELVNAGKLNEDAADLISTWGYTNTWKFREIKPKYEKKYGTSDKWKQLMAWKKEGDVRYKFYDYIRTLSEQANKALPYSNRIGLRLPGVANDFRERAKTGHGLIGNFKESLSREFNVKEDDIERDQKFYRNSKGKVNYFLPIHYTSELDSKTQSYDIPTIFFKFWEMGNDYHHKQQILPEMELVKHIIDNRAVEKPSKPRGRSMKGLVDIKSKRELQEDINNLSKQVNDWMMAFVYGHPKKDEGTFKLFGMTFDKAKLADFMNKYTAFNLLGLNLLQGTANALIGEVMQTAEAIAGEYMNIKSYTKGTSYYFNNLPSMMGDVGRRGNQSVASLLMESFEITHEPVTEDLGKAQKVRYMGSDALHMFTKAGEHEMQGRFLFGSLVDKRAYDKVNGKDIGNILQYYTAENGKLVFDKEGKVDLKRSQWTERDRFLHYYKLGGIFERIHGAYGPLEKVAVQRLAVGRMGYMFRKFVLPGFKRRFGRRAYIERLEDSVEGNYRTTTRFFGALAEDAYKLKFDLLANEWNELSDHEKANVRRTITELAFLTLSLIMAKVFLAALQDEDDPWDERYYSFLAYQAARLKSELLFFTSPKEAFAILRSPAASISMLENVLKLSGQVFNIRDTYERGPWKGKPKIYKTLNDMVPGKRQYYRLRDMREQTSWFTDDIRVPEWMTR